MGNRSTGECGFVRLLRRRWLIERAEPVLFIGECGTGKTHLLMGIRSTLHCALIANYATRLSAELWTVISTAAG